MKKLQRGIVAMFMLAAVGLTGCDLIGDSAKLQQDAMQQASRCITPPTSGHGLDDFQPRYSWIACYN